jgi:hypothetical protein
MNARWFWLAMVSVLFGFQARASHIIGGDIAYECVAPGQYLVTLTLYEDCAAAFQNNAAQSINITNNCGYNQNFSLPNTVFQQDVSPYCSVMAGQSTCNGGTLPGTYMHQWSGLVSISSSATCGDFLISYATCCRGATTNLQATPGFYYSAVIEANTPCNNSPFVTSQALGVPYFCVNSAVSYQPQIIDVDGDSLVYSLIAAYDNATTPVTYQAGYSGGAPITGINIDPQTGMITFTPSILGSFVVVIEVDEYDAFGNYKGTFRRDVLFRVINCVNNAPQPPVSMTNFSGTALQTGAFEISACPGESACFDLVFTDADATDVLSLSTAIQTQWPGSTVNVTGSNPLTVNVCAFFGMPDTLTTVDFMVTDGGCPLELSAFAVLGIVASPSTLAGPNQVLCDTASAQLTATGGNTFTWSVLSGDPIVTGVNFSCNPCANPVATPMVTTTYLVTSDLVSSCGSSQDTVIVEVPQSFNLALQDSLQSCSLDATPFTVTPDAGSLTYNYQWYPASYVDNPNSSTVSVVSNGILGEYLYVDVTSNEGCVVTDSLWLQNASFLIQFSVPGQSCGQDSVLLQATAEALGGTVMCGASGGCLGTPVVKPSGVASGSNTNTTYPALFGNWYANQKVQVLFRASELQAMGISAGVIDGITIETLLQNSAATLFKNYTIKMGCVSDPALTNTFITGLTQVFDPKDYNVLLGNNYMSFDTPYQWDGISNLVIETCYDYTTAGTYTANWSSPYETTSYNSCSYYINDNTAACPQNTAPTLNANRPVIGFQWCASGTVLTSADYSWTPASLVAQPDSANTLGFVQSPGQWFALVVTDTTSGCVQTDSIYVQTTPYTWNVQTSVTQSCQTDTTLLEIDFSAGFNQSDFTYQWTGNAVYGTPNAAITDAVVSSPEWLLVDFQNISSGCTHTDSVFVNVLNMDVEIFADDTVICEGDTIQLQAIVSPAGPSYNYNWSGAAFTSPSASSTSALVSASANVIVSVYDPSSGCFSGSSLFVTVSDTISNSIAGNVNIGVNSTEGYSVVYDNGYNYDWYITGGVIISGQATDAVDVFWGAAGTGIIGVIITDPVGCNSDTLELTVNIGYIGVEELQDGDISVYPNPVTESSVIQIKNGVRNGTMEIYSAQGKLIQLHNFENTDRIEIGNLIAARGLYTVVLKTEQGNFRLQLVK